ncbi:MAG: hypothetical protein ABI649_07645 [Gaiellaceae bacterium]
MSPVLLQRQAALAAAALLAAVGVVALDRSDAPADTQPAPSVSPQVRWEEAVVGVFGAGRLGETTSCGVELAAETRGIAHPVLPCGADLVVSFGGRDLRTEVIDRGQVDAGRQFDLSEALAAALGVQGTQTVRWRFAG